MTGLGRMRLRLAPGARSTLRSGIALIIKASGGRLRGLIEEGAGVVLEVAHTLDGWGEFYVIVGAAAAALTGLMFVVIALRADGESRRSIDTFEAFGTPTVVQLCTVLMISAIATVPQHSE